MCYYYQQVPNCLFIATFVNAYLWPRLGSKGVICMSHIPPPVARRRRKFKIYDTCSRVSLVMLDDQTLLFLSACRCNRRLILIWRQIACWLSTTRWVKARPSENRWINIADIFYLHDWAYQWKIWKICKDSYMLSSIVSRISILVEKHLCFSIFISKNLLASILCNFFLVISLLISWNISA